MKLFTFRVISILGLHILRLNMYSPAYFVNKDSNINRSISALQSPITHCKAILGLNPP